ncbi:unnamed protein product [Ectocarpus sp. CCAP 1310/34]|nr:unnamed protein product [Ectocarpus sp. CCAP 1310/34]
MSMFRQVLSRDPGQLPSGIQGNACAIGWGCEGRLATATTSGEVLLADVDSHGNARVKSSFVAHGSKDGTEALAWHPSDRNQLATCSVDKSLKVWDVRSTNRAVQEHISDGENLNVNYSPDGHYIAMGSSKKERNTETDILGIYDMRTRKKLKSVKFTILAHDYKWSPNGEYIINATETGSIDVMAFGSTKPLSRVRSTKLAHTAPCKALAIDPFNRYLASGGDDGLVSLWELDDFVCVRTIACEGEVRSLSFTPDGRFIAISISGGDVEIAEVETAASAHSLPGAKSQAVEFHPKRPLLAGIASRPGRGDFGLRLWSFVC